MDLTRSDALENRWLETVAEGLPLFLGAQLAIDPTLVSVFRRNGTPGPQCANEDGAALVAARRRKEGTYPELTGRDGRTRLVVLACEVGCLVVRSDHGPQAEVAQGVGPGPLVEL